MSIWKKSGSDDGEFKLFIFDLILSLSINFVKTAQQLREKGRSVLKGITLIISFFHYYFVYKFYLNHFINTK